MAEVITSSQNTLIKMAASLKQKKYRDEAGLFIVEGIRLAEELARSDWQAEVCIYTEEAAHSGRVQAILDILSNKKCRMIIVPPAVYHKITDTEQPQGIMVLAHKRILKFADLLKNWQQPLFVILDKIQDPGNVGTVIRTADASGCTAVVLTRGCADLFSGKTVRATMGSLFHLPVLEGYDNAELITTFKNNDIAILATALESSNIYFKTDFNRPAAIVFGNEGSGVSAEMLRMADSRLYIPILGGAESLNVAVAAGVILYEAVRQRY